MNLFDAFKDSEFSLPLVDLNRKKIVVTGGLGFIGFNFIKYICKNYKNVYIVNIDKRGIGSNDLSLLKEFTIDLGNGLYKDTIRGNTIQNVYVDLMSTIVDIANIEQIEYVFHFAAESHVDRSIGSPEPFICNNIMGITNLLEIFRTRSPKTRIINISTDEVYGHLSEWDEPFQVGDPLNPRSPYSASKASADLIARSYVETFGMDIVTTRCCNNFGPYQCDEKFIPTIVRNILQGSPVPIYGSGENIREWIHVEDHNRHILKVASFGKAGEVYHIGSNIERSNLELVREISKFLKNYEPTFQFIEDRKGHDFRYALSVDEPIDIGDFNDNLEATVRFYEAKYKSE